MLTNILIVIACVVGAVAFLFAVTRASAAHSRKESNDFTGAVVAVIGTTYAVLLAFMLSGVWNMFQQAEVNAEQEAKRVLHEAAGRSDLLLEKTQARLEDIQREIDGMKLKRRDVETTLEAAIQTLRNTLDFVREQESRERDDRILLHRPRFSDAAEEEPQERRRAQGLS